MADNLQIVVDTARAQKALDALGTASDRLLDKLSKISGTSNLDKIVASITQIDSAAKGVSSGGLDNIQKAINGLDLSKLANAATQLSSLGNVNLGSTVSSVGQLQNAINGINSRNIGAAQQSLAGIGGTASATSERFNSFATAVRNAVGQMGGMTANASTMAGALFSAGGSVQSLVSHLSNLLNVSKATAAAMLAFGGIVVFKQLADQAGQLGKAIAEPSMQIERFKSAIDAVAGAGAGAKAFSDLQNITKQVGGNISQMLDPFQKFVIAAKAANVDMKTSVDVFRGFQTGLTATGASAVQTERVFNALQQMMSKGTVQAEELKGQLGDSMAGALDIAAKSMGVTTKELLKLVEGGKVMASDLLPNMARELENTFGELARNRMKTFTGQVDALHNNIFMLTAAFGQGGLGGAVSGLTGIMQQLNAAFTIPGVEGFVRLLGDLTGILLNLGGTVLGGVLSGLGAMAAAIGGIYNVITGAITGVRDFLNESGALGKAVLGLVSGLGSFAGQLAVAGVAMATVAGTMRMLASIGLVKTFVSGASAVAKYVASLVGISGAAATADTSTTALNTATGAGLVASLRSGAVSAGAFTLSLNGMTLAQRAAAIATVGISGAFTALTTAMRANPFTAIAAAAAAMYVALDQFGVFDRVSDGFKKMTAAAEAAKTTTTLYNEAAERLTARAKLGADTIFNAATKFTTYAEMADRAKQATKDMEEQQKSLTRSMEENGRQLKEQELREKSYQDSVRASSESLKHKIDREKESQASSKELAKIADQHSSSLEKSAALQKSAGDAAKMTADAVKQNSYAYDSSAATIANYSQKIRDNDAAIKASEMSLNSAKARHEEMSIATKRSAEEIERAQESIKKYGVLLDESQQKLVTIIERTGKHGEAAAQAAVQVSNLTRSQGDWVKMLDAEIEANNRKLKAQQEIIDLLERENKALDAKKASGQALTDLDKIMMDGRNTLIASWKKEAGGVMDVVMAQETLKIAMDGTGKSISEAAKIVAEKYTTALGQSVNSANVAAEAQKQLAKQLDATGGSTDKLGAIVNGAKGVWDSFATAVGKAFEAFTTNKSVESVKVGLDKVATSATTAKDGFAGIETSTAALAGSMNTLGASTTLVATNLPLISTALGTMKEPLAGIQPSIEPIATGFASMGASLPVVAAAFVQTRDALTPLVEVMPQLIEPLNAMKTAFEGMSPHMEPISLAMQTMSTTFPLIAASGPQVASAFQAIGTSVDKIKELPAAVTALNTAMTEIAANADVLTVKANDFNIKLKEVLDTFSKSKEATDAFGANMASVRSAIDETVSKLDELIKKAEEAARAMANANGGGGGGGGDRMTAGSQRLGGMAGGAPQTTSVSASAFAGAPKLAMGIANTNDLVKRGGGGFPTILHPNEAVVPLPRGRSIPVDMRVSGGEQLQQATESATRTLKALGDIELNQGVRAPGVGGYNSPMEALSGRGALGVGRSAPTPLREASAVSAVKSGRSSVGLGGRVDQTVNPNGGGAPVTVNMTVNVKDADSFKKSQPQIQTDMFRAISRQASKDR